MYYKKMIKELGTTTAMALVLDEYDYNNNPNHISNTSLVMSTRKYILQQVVGDKEDSLEYDNFINRKTFALVGNAVHYSKERVWKDTSLQKTLFTKLGFPSTSTVVVNTTEQEEKGKLYVYSEQRLSITIGKWTVSSKVDQIVAGTLSDTKVTKCFHWGSESKERDYSRQLSIARYVAVKGKGIFVKDSAYIEFVFLDWSGVNKAKHREGEYPPTACCRKEIKLMTLEDTERFIKNRLTAIERYKTNKNLSELPKCDKLDLWITEKAPTYKLYAKGVQTKRSTKNFTTEGEAELYNEQKFGGAGLVVKYTPYSKTRACSYCSGKSICTQYLIEDSGF